MKKYVLRGRPKSVAFKIPYEERLNEEQLAVAMAEGGPLLVVAGAGSGKTRTLTYRVARLIESGVAADRILLLTFTNRAAREMTGRVAELLQADAHAVWGGTFHSIARRLLREHPERIGYPPRFNIIDQEDAQDIVKACIASVPRNTRGRFPKARTILNAYSAAINTGTDIAAVIHDRYSQFEEHLETIEAVLGMYQSRKREYGVMDFDDLLLNWRRLLVENDDLREKYAHRFEHILVDEYQDTNHIQAELVDMMAAGHRNLMVVGDDFQSIYSFRGADFRNILQFPERYPDCKRHLLHRNYRSSPQILALSNRSIAHNKEQFDKELTSECTDGAMPAVVRCRDESEQAMFVAQRILELRDEGVDLERIAVLYRAHWQSLELQVELQRQGVPFLVRSGQRFFEQRHVKDVLAFLRFLQNPRDELAFQRLVGLGDGLGPSTANKLFLYMRAHDDVRHALQSPDIDRIPSRRGKPAWQTLKGVLLRLTEDRYRSSAAESLDVVTTQFYEEYAQRSFDNFPNRLRELDLLATFASQYGPSDDFLDSLALSGSISGVDVTQSNEADEHLVLSTIHQAKGLEFHAVFVIWVGEDRFPSARSMNTPEEIEEERRLFYVACTRAERELYLTLPISAYDRREGYVLVRESLFIEELRTAQMPVYERWNLVQG